MVKRKYTFDYKSGLDKTVEFCKNKELGYYLSVSEIVELSGVQNAKYTTPATEEYMKWVYFIKDLREILEKDGIYLVYSSIHKAYIVKNEPKKRRSDCKKKDRFVLSSDTEELKKSLEIITEELKGLKVDNQKLYNELCDVKEECEGLYAERENLLEKISEYEEKLSNIPVIANVVKEQEYKNVIKSLAALLA